MCGGVLCASGWETAGEGGEDTQLFHYGSPDLPLLRWHISRVRVISHIVPCISPHSIYLTQYCPVSALTALTLPNIVLSEPSQHPPGQILSCLSHHSIHLAQYCPTWRATNELCNCVFFHIICNLFCTYCFCHRLLWPKRASGYQDSDYLSRIGQRLFSKIVGRKGFTDTRQGPNPCHSHD